ncbi:MAG: VacJ family lipoprotein [Alphaproteobacteria bacterium]|nr:VacJ family lipoprotein [Alphaproteobacteria bacterium]
MLPALLLVCSCARPSVPGDPFEPVNRAVFAFNEKFNRHVTLPLDWVYTYQLPLRLKRPLHNLLSNLQSPVVFANDVLQGHVQSAAETLARFFLNSTLGLGGLNDFAAAHAALPSHRADFGQTLADYGVGSGPFLELPVIGPTSARDAFGAIVDIIANPLFYIPNGWSLLAHTGTVVGVGTVSSFQAKADALYLRTQLSHDSLDPYATMRSAYHQHREDEVRGTSLQKK